MKTFASLLFFLVFSHQGFAQPAVDVHSKIRTATAERNYPAAIAELLSLEKEEPVIFKLNNYDYLLARSFEKNGDFAAAMASYQNVAARDSVLKEYALWHLSHIARSSGNLMLERTYLQELVSFSPNSLLLDAARNRLARSWFESRNYDLAIKSLTAQLFGADPPKSGTTRPPVESAIVRENRLLLAQAYLRSGNTVAAREISTTLIASSANPAQPDDFAIEAAKNLDMLDVGSENFGKTAPALSDYEHLRRGQIYQFNRDFDNARLHFAAIINNHPTSGIVPDAIFQIGRSYAQQGNFTDAVKWFERVLEQFPEHPVSKDALLQAASAYSRVTKFKEAIGRYQKYIERYPDDERVDRAYLNIIDILRDEGEEIEAQKWAAKVQGMFKGKLPEVQALFAEVRIYLARNDWPKALDGLEKLQTFSELGGASVPGGTSTAEITFLKGFVFEQTRRYAEAIDVYLSIPDGRGEYYGWRATERIKLLAKDEAARPFITAKLGILTNEPHSKDYTATRKDAQAALRLTESPGIREKIIETLKRSYANLPAYKAIPSFKLQDVGRREVLRQKSVSADWNPHKTLANELLFLGLYAEAAPELEFALKETGQPKGKTGIPRSGDFDYTLAVLHHHGDIANRAIAFAEPLWRNIPADYQIDLIPLEQLELLYPAPYVDSLLKYALPRKVDPRFLLAIMRQESRYRADVKSYAAARGLMQFISTTSEKIAGELGHGNFRQDELYNPPTAILFGSQYAANLFKLFPDQPPAVAASYNGGEDNMKRWLGRSKSDLPDRYVPEIAFSQSKDYVYKVMANYRVYQMVYDENLKLR